METPRTTTHLPEAILTKIQVRLPLRSISRFKLVCKTWKSTIESVYFRRLFVYLHKNSSISWSLMCGAKELVGFHGCEAWDLPKSPGSYIPPRFKSILTLDGTGNFGYAASSNGLVLIEGSGYACYVGNPVLQQWVQIPAPPHDSAVLGLATRVDEEGVVLVFKVVRLAALEPTDDELFSTCLSVCVYSSETGIWTCKRLHCPHHITNPSALSLNGTIYLCQSGGVLITHDFYAESDQCLVIPLPDHSNINQEDFKRAVLTTSKGFVMFIKILDHTLKIWRLINDSADGSWHLFGGICLPFIGSYAPMAMHPFDTDIVYIWSQENGHLVSCNLRTQNYGITSKLYNDDDHQNCLINQFVCEEYMDEILGSQSVYWDYGNLVTLSQFVLPRWMESIPRPPHVEMIDTNSLLSSMQRTKQGVRG